MNGLRNAGDLLLYQCFKRGLERDYIVFELDWIRCLKGEIKFIFVFGI